MAWTVKQVAERTGVSVRALHHYDRLGLLRPAYLSEAGYRFYAEAELGRLQQILFYRALGFELKRIAELLDAPDFDPLQALKEHRDALSQQQGLLARLLRTCDASIAALERGEDMTAQEHFDGLAEAEQAAWAQEAEARWGHTEAWRQSQARFKDLGPGAAEQIKAELAELWGAYAAAMDAGPPDGPLALAAAEAQWRHFHTRFYDCPLVMLKGLGSMYVDDPRFHRNFEPLRPGLTAFVRDAIHAFAAAQAERGLDEEATPDQDPQGT